MEQPQYNLIHRTKVETEFAPLYPQYGLGLTTFSPLRFGILSGKYNGTTIPADSRFGEGGAKDAFIATIREKFTNDDDMKLQLAASAKLGVIAEELGVKQSQLAIAWILLNENISSVITGASRPEQVVENIGALEVKKLITPEVRKRIEEAFEGTEKAGPVEGIDVKRFGAPPESL